MFSSLRKLPGGLLVGLLFAGVVRLYAGVNKLESLLDNSPFGAPPAKKENAASDSPKLELRSILVDGDQYMFSIYDPSAKRSYWVKQNEPDGPVIVRNYDRAVQLVHAEFKGQLVKLSLKFSPQTGGLSQRSLAKAAPFIRIPNVNVQVALAPLGEGEARRLELVSAQVRERRSARLKTATREIGTQPH